MMIHKRLPHLCAGLALSLGALVGCSSGGDDDPALDGRDDGVAGTAATGTGPTTSQSTAVPATVPTTVPATIAATTAPPTTIAPVVYLEEELRLSVPNQPTRQVIGLYGDSLMDSVREHVLFNLQSGGRLDVRHDRVFSGSALCFFLPGIKEDLLSGQVWGAIVWFSGNTTAPCAQIDGVPPEDPDVILTQVERELAELGEIADSMGVRLWLPDFPVSRVGQYTGELLDGGLNAIVTRLAAEYDMVSVLPVASSVLDEHGRYTETLPCLPTEPCLLVDEDGVGVNFVREPDGTHFCTGGFHGTGQEDARWGTCPTYSSGAVRIAAAMAAPVLEASYADWVATPEAQNPPVTLPSLVSN